MLFEWEERGKVALLECVRKLKHERVIGLDFPLWLRHRAAPLPTASVKQVRVTEVSNHLF